MACRDRAAARVAAVARRALWAAVYSAVRAAESAVVWAACAPVWAAACAAVRAAVWAPARAPVCAAVRAAADPAAAAATRPASATRPPARKLWECRVCTIGLTSRRVAVAPEPGLDLVPGPHVAPHRVGIAVVAGDEGGVVLEVVAAGGDAAAHLDWRREPVLARGLDGHPRRKRVAFLGVVAAPEGDQGTTGGKGEPRAIDRVLRATPEDGRPAPVRAAVARLEEEQPRARRVLDHDREVAAAGGVGGDVGAELDRRGVGDH